MGDFECANTTSTGRKIYKNSKALPELNSKINHNRAYLNLKLGLKVVQDEDVLESTYTFSVHAA